MKSHLNHNKVFVHTRVCHTLRVLKRLGGYSLLSRSLQSGEKNMFKTHGVNSITKKQGIIGALLSGAENLFYRIQREADTGDSSGQARCYRKTDIGFHSVPFTSNDK